jgi:Rod binding domain-containing protein
MTEIGSVNSGIGPLPKDDEARLRYAAQKLEAVWLSHVLKEGRGDAQGFLDNSLAGRTFRDMLDESLADSIAASGKFGLAENLVRQLMPAVKAPAGDVEAGGGKQS